MIAHALSTTLVGIDAMLIDVETQILGALKRFTIVGLPDGVVREARDRVRGALEHTGFSFPYGEVIVSLGPATLPKAGSGFDLAIALTILAAMGAFSAERLRGRIFLGELGLDGSIRQVPGVLAAACCAQGRSPTPELIVPRGSEQEALLSGELVVRSVESLDEIVGFLAGSRDLVPWVRQVEQDAALPSVDGVMSDVVGQHGAKRAMEIAAAGAHNLCLVGPPGAGKTMLAKRLREVLPSLTNGESLEVTKVYAAYAARGGVHFELPRGLRLQRPFRAPHHTTTAVGLVGGGVVPVPGEISLAHRGILFLDELPEIRREVLECLREPLETRSVVISRSRYRVSFPADFILVAAMNPCPCGRRGVSEISCRCSPPLIARYLGRISGPILDRIDLQVWVPPVPIEELARGELNDTTAEVITRISRARRAQHERLGSELRTNSSMTQSELRQWCSLGAEARRWMERSAERANLSARAYARVLKVARTVADLEQERLIGINHLAEVFLYRSEIL